MSRLTAIIRNDVRIQMRYRIYAALAFVILLYVAVLIFASPYLPISFLSFVIYADPSVLGFFFLGGLMLFERNEGTRMALGISPLSATEYLTSKFITLTALALAAVIVMAIASGKPVRWPLYLVTVSLVSVHYIGLGAMFAVKFRTVTGYLFGSSAILIPLILPGAAAFLDPMPMVLAVIPAVSHLKLIQLSFSAADGEPWRIGCMLAVSGLAAAIGFWIGLRALRDEFGRK